MSVLMQCKISQSGRMDLQDIVGLPFDVVAACSKPFTWDEIFARIPIREQKETNFADDAKLKIEGYLPHAGVGVTIHKMLAEHSFGHLIAENKKGVLQMSPVYVLVHHIAYDCGDQASLIHQLRHGDADESDEEDNDNMDGGPLHTNRLYALQGYGREANAIEFFVSSDYECFNVPRWEELLLFTIDNL
jgi:hypothetical protein